MKSRSLLAAIFTLTLFPVLAPVVRAADAEPAPENPRVTEAKLSVSGLGLWRKRELRVALQRLPAAAGQLAACGLCAGAELDAGSADAGPLLLRLLRQLPAGRAAAGGRAVGAAARRIERGLVAAARARMAEAEAEAEAEEAMGQ